MDYEAVIKKAQKAREHAYAPYSGFKVGAALLAANGEVYSGCNIENSSYGLSMCAERVAVYKAVCAGTKDFRALVLATDTTEPASPCGACRQVLAEFSPELEIIMVNLSGQRLQKSLRELLPLAFDKNKLGKEKSDA